MGIGSLSFHARLISNRGDLRDDSSARNTPVGSFSRLLFCSGADEGIIRGKKEKG
jgi:hypothetical protein